MLYDFYKSQPRNRADNLLEMIKEKGLCLDGRFEILDAGFTQTDEKYKIGLLLAYRKDEVRIEEYMTDERIKRSLSKCSAK